MSICDVCSIPADAGFFDESSIKDAPYEPGEEVVLAHYELPRNYCGVLVAFAQLAQSRGRQYLQTPDYQWQVRCNNSPLPPYLTFCHVVNPWGLPGFPIALRLPEDSIVELVVRYVGTARGGQLTTVGGRIVGRYWYNPIYGSVEER